MSGFGVPVHTPLWQVSPVVQVLLSLHAVPSGWRTSAGQLLDEPSQLSATSHWSAAGRQTAVLFASAGQLLLTPSQLSARSHGPAAARQTAVLFPSAGRSPPRRSQVSAVSQAPAGGRQTKAPATLCTASGGHSALVPVQLSAMSHGPADARQVTDAGWKPSAGQSLLTPSQFSG